ncbi:MAG: Hint domain-containing protein [Planktotalea sp.]|uniref:Hint domain-containing protein n=1 Tax=Planktotalea sp. TaxID=2029877 RepID=UPI003C744D7B
MNVNSTSLVLRNDLGSVVCNDLDAGGQTPHQVTSYCPCFTPGTLIKTDQGELPVEEIAVGTRVLTRDNGYQTVLWAAASVLPSNVLKAHPNLQPIQISKGALGPNLPERVTRVSPQHRMLLNNDQIRRWFNSDEVLVPAHLLTCFEGISHVEVSEVTYIHFMFEQHEIILADGAWSESYQPSDMRAGAIDERHRAELISIFPELDEKDAEIVFPAARASINADELSQALFPPK